MKGSLFLDGIDKRNTRYNVEIKFLVIEGAVQINRLNFSVSEDNPLPVVSLDIESFHIPAYIELNKGNKFKVKTVSNNVLLGNESTFIDTLYIDDGIVSVTSNAFKNAKVRKIVWPASCPDIEGRTFEDSTLEEIVGIEKVKHIFGNAFINCKNLKHIVWPTDCEYIPAFVFCGCESLKTINNIENVKSIGKYAFNESGIENFVIPSKCEFIDSNAFYHCRELKTVKAEKGDFISISTDSFLDKFSIATFDVSLRNTIIVRDSNLDKFKKEMGNRYIENIYGFPVELPQKF